MEFSGFMSSKGVIMIRRAKEEDINNILELLHQVCMVHHLGRPD